MNKADKYYIKNLKKILKKGSWDENPRPRYLDGTPAYSKFITQVFEEYDLSRGEFPIPTLRNTAIKTGIKEIMWIYQKQSSSLRLAHSMGVNWWDDWNVGDNTIGQRYGATIKRYDLMNKLLKGLVEDPFGRRHIINMYQYIDLEETNGLFPCAYEIICSVRKKEKYKFLDLTLIQRSNDYITASHINKNQYVALQMMIAGHCGYQVGKFCHLIQNLHIYDRHLNYIDELISNQNSSIKPYFKLNGNKNFYDYKIEDFDFFEFDKLKPLSNKLELAI